LSWLHHHKFEPVRDRVLAQFASKNASFFHELRPVVFICGANKSTVRDRVAGYLASQHPKLLVFYADEVWQQISTTAGLNALAMENELAGLSDMLLIIVESAGTFAELGAFSLSESLRKKLLPILDRKYQHDPSFVNTGPIRWIDAESIYKPAIWTHHDRVLECAIELDERIRKVSQRISARVDNVAESPKHLLFHVCDLVSAFGPTTVADVEFYLTKTLRQPPSINVASLIALAKAARLIQSKDIVGHPAFYYRPLVDGEQIVFQRRHNLFVPRMRMQVMSVLQLLPEARAVISGIWGTE
jgi:hypothetical protein